MNDLINRQAAIDVLEERLQANGYSNVALVSELNRSIGYLMRLPSADVVEVVRCKDCKHYGMRESVCKLLSNNYEPPVVMDDEGYCSYGERK